VYRLEQSHGSDPQPDRTQKRNADDDGGRVLRRWALELLKHTKVLVLEEHFVVLWRGSHSVQCRVPSRWICHDPLLYNQKSGNQSQSSLLLPLYF